MTTKPAAKSDRKTRLAEALRANLRRRKAASGKAAPGRGDAAGKKKEPGACETAPGGRHG